MLARDPCIERLMGVLLHLGVQVQHDSLTSTKEMVVIVVIGTVLAVPVPVVPSTLSPGLIGMLARGDKPLLRLGSYIDINCESLKMDKITIYVEQPCPFELPTEPVQQPPQPLRLTKKEQKKRRTQRRLTKEKDRQEMIRQGLIEPPKPKVKMSHLMKVLDSEMTQNPALLEMEICSAAAERGRAHVDRNIARKVAPAEHREKKERHLFEDTNTLETFVLAYKIKCMTDPKTRFMVDANAQENRLSGLAVISDGITVVIVEGGKKSINGYRKLMLRRIDWAADGNG